MVSPCFSTDGVGLAAPQVGVNVRLMVYNPEGERGKGKEYILVNPKIVKFTKETDTDLEGCLSFPSKSGVGTFDADVKVLWEPPLRIATPSSPPYSYRLASQ